MIRFYPENSIKWAAQNDVQAELVELTCSEDESLSMVERGDLDAYVTVDAFVKADRAVPVCKVGASDFYFAVSQKRPDLLSTLNDALNRIQDEDRYYNQRMFEKHIKRAGANAFLSANEVDWLARHGTIRVGYQDDYTFEGVEKQGAWLPLSNGMRLNVTVPISETDAGWQRVVRMILVFSGGVLLVMSAFTMLYMRRITRPLEELTEAAEQVNRGDYDFTLLYSGNDEVGRLILFSI